MIVITIAVDFDGTLFHEDSEGSLHPVPGAVEAMEELSRRNYRVVIHSCRTGIASEQGRLANEIQFIDRALRKFHIPFDEIYTGPKMVADLYVDDRAIPFTGNWEQTTIEIQSRSESLIRLIEAGQEGHGTRLRPRKRS